MTKLKLDNLLPFCFALILTALPVTKSNRQAQGGAQQKGATSSGDERRAGPLAKPEAPSPFIFAVLSDPQIGMVEEGRDRVNFAAVVSAINKLEPQKRPQLAFIAGDLVNQAKEQTQLAIFNDIKKDFAMPVYPVPGNHDMAGDGKHFDAELLVNYRQKVGEDRFAIERGGCLFVGLNSQLWVEGGALAAEQYGWLEQHLQNAKRHRHIFIIQHHPLFLAEAGEADEYFNTPRVWRAKLLRLLERAKVSAVITGHLHRNRAGSYRGINMITIPSTCLNFDGSAYGYALFSVTDEGFTQYYTGVPGTLPDKRTPAAAQ